MKTNCVFIPTSVYDKINISIQKELDFIDLTEKQKSNLIKQLVSLWFFIYTSQKNDELAINLKSYTKIQSRLLQRFYIKLNNQKIGYNKLNDILERNGLITINENFCPIKFSKSYRVVTDFIGNNYTEVEIDFDKVFDNLKNKSYWVKKYPQYKKQINDTYEVEIDLDNYIHWLNQNSGLELKPVIKNGILSNRFLTQERIYDYINDALKINLNNIWFKVSNEGRFYNSTTNLSYTAMPFIKLKRRKLIEIDVKNCQPLLLCKLIDNPIYKKDVEEGVFYEKMKDVIGISRNQMKVLSYKYIFFSNKKLNGGKIYDALQKLYPGLIDQINQLRNEIEISKELQKLESDIFVKSISYLDFKMMLRHDAVFVYEEDYEIIKSYIQTEFNKIGLKATIK